MSDVKQAHKVPTFYLENFVGSTPAGQVWNYDKTSNNRWSAKPGNSAKQKDFYAVIKEDGTKDLTIENYLAKVEGKANAGYKLLLQGNIPSGQIRADFATFLALQFTRTSKMRQLWAEGHGRSIYKKVQAVVSNKAKFDTFMADREKETGHNVPAERKEKIRANILRPSEFFLSVPQDITLEALLPADDMMEAIFDMEWSIGHTANAFFLTSDNPVAPYCDQKILRSGESIRKIHYHPATMIDFPLSPKSILVLNWRKMKNNFRVSDAMVAKTNRERIIRADRFIYAHLNDDIIGNLVSEYKDTKWGLNADYPADEFPEVKVKR